MGKVPKWFITVLFGGDVAHICDIHVKTQINPRSLDQEYMRQWITNSWKKTIGKKKFDI
jgi:hypothetical protein